MNESKQKLLKTAIALIWEHSYGSVSVDDICTHSGVKKGSFYHFFASKSELAVAAYDLHWQNYKHLYDTIFNTVAPPLARIESWCENTTIRQYEIFAAKGRVLGCPYATVGSELSTQDENVRKKSQEIFLSAAKYIEIAISDAIKNKSLPIHLQPIPLSQEIMGYMIGILMNARIQNDPEIIRRDLHKGVFSLLGIASAEAA